MLNASLISNSNNYLKLFTNEGDIKVDTLSKFMEISRIDLAKMFGLTGDQLRPDRMGERTKEKLKELAGALEYVAETYGGDIQKAKFWIKTPNPHFGGATPRTLILRGRYKKVEQFIWEAKAA